MPEKTRECVAVGWKAFDAVCEHQADLLKKLRFAIRAAEALDDPKTALAVISDLLDRNDKELGALLEASLPERAESELRRAEAAATDACAGLDPGRFGEEDRGALERLVAISRRGGEAWENLKAMIEGVYATLQRSEARPTEASSGSEPDRAVERRSGETESFSSWKGKLVAFPALFFAAAVLYGLYFLQTSPTTVVEKQTPRPTASIESAPPTGYARSHAPPPECAPPPTHRDARAGSASVAGADGILREGSDRERPEAMVMADDEPEPSSLQASGGAPAGEAFAAERPAASASSAFASDPVRGHLFEITAEEESWVSVGIDYGKLRSCLLKPGEKKSWEAAKSVRVTLGNAGGVQMKWDGKAIETGSKPGRVLRLQLPEALAMRKS